MKQNAKDRDKNRRLIAKVKYRDIHNETIKEIQKNPLKFPFTKEDAKEAYESIIFNLSDLSD
jgi:hypothetical protein